MPEARYAAQIRTLEHQHCICIALHAKALVLPFERPNEDGFEHLINTSIEPLHSGECVNCENLRADIGR